MNLDKESFFILQYIYKKNITTYGDLKKHFSKKPVFDLVSVLCMEKAVYCETVRQRTSNGRTGSYFYDEAKISCTTLGKKYVEDIQDKRKDKRMECIRYSITTAIAILALILSGIAVAAQLGLIKLPAP